MESLLPVSDKLHTQQQKILRPFPHVEVFLKVSRNFLENYLEMPTVGVGELKIHIQAKSLHFQTEHEPIRH